MVAFCLEVTAPKSVSLPTGPSELHRNPICCHWARTDRTETRFAASTAGAPDVFPDVELRSMAEFLLCRLAAFHHLSLSAFLALPLPRCSMWVPALRECSSNAVSAHPPPRNPSRTALSGPRRRSPARRSPWRNSAPRCWGCGPCGTRTAWLASHARARSPPMHAATVVGYDR